MKIPHTFLETQTLCFNSYKNWKLKLRWVGTQESKKRAFFVQFILSKGIFFNICFISMYSVLNTISQYTYFYISKNKTSYTFLLAFKIVESLQFIVKLHTIIDCWQNFIYLKKELGKYRVRKQKSKYKKKKNNLLISGFILQKQSKQQIDFAPESIRNCIYFKQAGFSQR